MSTTSASRNSLTLRALPASLLVIFLSGVVGQLSGVLDTANSLIGVEALPVPALVVLFPLLAAGAGVAALSRTRLLSRADLLVVTLSALIATPLMTVGFWRYQLATLGCVARFGDWTKLEALPEGLWPHGPNLLARALEPGAPGIERRGPARGKLGHFASDDAKGLSTLRLRVDLAPQASPVTDRARAVAVPGRPYLFSARVRASRLGPDARYFVRLYTDDSAEIATELFSQAGETKQSPLFPDGSQRFGYYPLELPAAAKRSVTFELGLAGAGDVSWHDLRLYDVRAIELAYKGYSRVTPDELGRLSLADRQSVVVVPDQILSLATWRYVLGLDYPLSDWLPPIARLAAFVLLVLCATFALSLFYRKQWLENERFALPLLKPLLALFGVSEAQGGQGPRFWQNRWLWLGFSSSLAWCGSKVLHGYFPSLPDLGLSISIKSYLSDPFWGRTWDDVRFEVYALFFGIGLLLDLKVLLSLVIGFLACRLQYCVGQVYGLSADNNFPHFPYQMLGAYLAYAGLMLALTRRYWMSAVRAAAQSGPVSRETAAQRAALLLLCCCALGFAAWARWVGAPLVAAAWLSGHVVLLGFVAAKLRAECGLPRAGFNHPLGLLSGYNVPVEPLLLVPLLGGFGVFGGSGLMVMTLVTASVLPYGLFLIPGLQLEALELGRRFGLRTRHLAAATLLSAAAGIVIGGWLYLTAAYGYGASKFMDTTQFGDRLAAFRGFNAELAAAQSAFGAGQAQVRAGADQAPLWALGLGAAATALVTLLRQWFPGFWFHPVGLLVGPSDMMQILWGSLLSAWLVRFLVLRLGGAATVREKLVPAAIGIFSGAVCGHALYIAGNAYWFFFNKGSLKFTGLL